MAAPTLEALEERVAALETEIQQIKQQSSDKGKSAVPISYEEQMRGWLAYVAHANTEVRQLEAYRKLLQHVERFRIIPVLPFNAEAAAELERLRQQRIRVGTMELKDFSKVHGLRAEDWSV